MTFAEKRIEAAIFDMDGTMFDTERLRMRMLKTASRQLFGQEMSDDLLLRSLGLSAVSARALAESTYGEQFPYQAIRDKADALERAYVRAHGVPVKPGLYDVLERLKKSGVLIALATSSRREIAEEYLRSAKVMRFFDILVCGDEVKKGKPDPEIFLCAAQALNCAPQDCLIFEDSANGLLAASAAGGLPVYIRDIKDPAPEIRAKAFCAYESMLDMLDELAEATPRMPMPKINEQFPQSVSGRKVGIHGFGAIGGGYLAQVFSHGDGYTRPSELIGATIDPVVRQVVNAFGRYAVRYESIAYVQVIERVRAIDMNDMDAMEEMYATCDLIGLSLPEPVVRLQADTIARCLLARYARTARPLTLLVVLNKINGGAYVKRHLREALEKRAGREKAQETMARTHICETVVNRMVTAVPDEELLRQVTGRLDTLRRNLSPLNETVQSAMELVDETGETGRTESVCRTLRDLSAHAKALSDTAVVLFSSEPDLPLYASDESPLVNRLRQVVPVQDIRRLQEIKNRLSNGTHAIAAWYAALLGYDSIGQGMGDERVYTLARRVMEEEIKPPLLAENPDLTAYINSFIGAFLKRCRVSFKDPCARVGRDPLRKLQDGERVFGAIRKAQAAGIPTPLLEYGAACGLLYAIRAADAKDAESKIIRDLYNRRGCLCDVLTWRGSYNGAPYKGLDAAKDANLIGRVKKQFEALQTVVDLRLNVV